MIRDSDHFKQIEIVIDKSPPLRLIEQRTRKTKSGK